jgi:dTDP-4-dehydrorhamnose reductase
VRVLITGGAGLLGQALVRSAPSAAACVATWRTAPLASGDGVRVELSDDGAVASLLRRVRPELVIHTAYGTEAPERDILRATRCVATAASSIGARLLHVSTDALLSGDAAPYDESAVAAPVHEYGRWKALAERAVRESSAGAAIVRPSLLVSLSPLDGQSRWVTAGLRAGTPVRLFVDEIRTPIQVDDLAAQLWELAALGGDRFAGVWNLAGPESLSRYLLGHLLAACHDLDPSMIVPARSCDHHSPRPRDLRMLTGRADRELRHRAQPISTLVLNHPAE